MSYLRLFIELRKEDTGLPCGQVRVELQDQPGRVDGKVRCSLAGLPVGALYDMALVCEQGGHYKEYPLGQFAVNPRGQAGPMFRGSFPAEPGCIPATEFKAVVARCQAGSRLVGFRFEPMLIPWQYEEEPVKAKSVHANEEVPADLACTPKKEVDGVAYTSNVEEPSAKPVCEPASKPEEEEAMEPDAKVLMYTEIPEEPMILVEPMAEPEMVEASAKEVFVPTAIFVMRDLNQVDLVCGDAGRRAFQRYRHLILAQQDQVNYLGIPCRFRPTQQMELAEEGYTLFYTPHGDEPSFGEFGYWMKRL